MRLRLVQRTAIYSACLSFSVCAVIVAAAAIAFEWQEETILKSALRAGIDEMRQQVEAGHSVESFISASVIATLSKDGDLSTVPESLRALTLGSHEILEGPFRQYEVRVQQIGDYRYFYGVSMVEAERREHQYALFGLFLLLLAALISGLWGWLFAGTLVRPMRVLVDEIHALEDRDLSVSIGMKAQDEIDEIATAVNRYRDRLRAAAEHQTQFLADVSHALRTPAAIIQSGLEVLEQRAAELPKVQELTRFESVLKRTSEHAMQLSLKVDALMLSAQGASETSAHHNVLEQIELALRYAGLRQAKAVTIDVPPGLNLPLREAVFRWLVVQCVQSMANCDLIDIRWIDGTGLCFSANQPSDSVQSALLNDLNAICQMVAKREGWSLLCVEPRQLMLVLQEG